MQRVSLKPQWGQGGETAEGRWFLYIQYMTDTALPPLPTVLQEYK